MKKAQNRKAVRPPKDVCLKCPDHGFCLAEDGVDNYVCTKDDPRKL